MLTSKLFGGINIHRNKISTQISRFVFIFIYTNNIIKKNNNSNLKIFGWCYRINMSGLLEAFFRSFLLFLTEFLPIIAFQFIKSLKRLANKRKNLLL